MFDLRGARRGRILRSMRSSASALLLVAAAACATPRPATAPVASAPSPPPAPSPVASAPASARVAPALPAADSRAVFEQTIKPILVSSCMPCHFPGGKMYATMPFDDPDVVSSHSEGVLRRIKAPEERGPLESWLGSVRPATR